MSQPKEAESMQKKPLIVNMDASMLIESVAVEMGGVVLSRVAKCQSCGAMAEMRSDKLCIACYDEKVWRPLLNK